MTRNAVGAATSLVTVPRSPLSIAYSDARMRAGVACTHLAAVLGNSEATDPEIEQAAVAAREASSLLAGYAHQSSH